MIFNSKGAIFDLDGVIVDTAKYHFLAWKKIADDLGIHFDEELNEKLKGVSRIESLNIILKSAEMQLEDSRKDHLLEHKNSIYRDMISDIDESELLPGSREYLVNLRNQGIKIALGSASKNATMILQCLKIHDLFDAIVDGNSVTKAKPDPEVFLKGAEQLQLSAKDCVVFEDSIAGVEAASAAGMKVVGIGNESHLGMADIVVKGLNAML